MNVDSGGRWDRLWVRISSVCRFSFLKQLPFQSRRINQELENHVTWSWVLTSPLLRPKRHSEDHPQRPCSSSLNTMSVKTSPGKPTMSSLLWVHFRSSGNWHEWPWGFMMLDWTRKELANLWSPKELTCIASTIPISKLGFLMLIFPFSMVFSLLHVLDILEKALPVVFKAHLFIIDKVWILGRIMTWFLLPRNTRPPR